MASEVKSADQSLAEYRLRTVRVGVWTSVFVIAAAVAYYVLPGHEPIDQRAYLLVLGIASAGVIAIAALPWRRLMASGRGMTVMYAWSVLDISLITLLIPLTGLQDSPMFFLYAFTTVFFAASYPLGAQVGLTAFTALNYVVLIGMNGWPIGPGELVLRVVFLAALSFMGSLLSLELRRQMRAQEAARSESERRAALLGAVARAGREVSSLETERVLQAVVEAARSLGFEGVNLVVYSDDGTTYRSAHAVGMPAEFTRKMHKSTVGMAGVIKDHPETLSVEDYTSHPNAVPVLLDAGFRSTIASPVWVRGRLSAALVGATTEQRVFTPQDEEAFELLAGAAGRALENARLFEEQYQNIQRLAELDQLKSDFISTVSHELRTPLTAIEGMGLTLEQRWDSLDEDLRKELLGRMNANTEALHRIIGTLLDFSRLEAGRMDVNLEAVMLRPLVDGVISRLRSFFENHDVVVDVTDDLSVRADPVLLERVIENLLSNAAKHTPNGTRIVLAATTLRGFATISVRDNGPGIPISELRYIGERFYRGGDANTRPTRGTGLGLALVREILKLHHSELEVESEIERGSRFAFRLPLAEPATAMPEDERRLASP
ncbi:MAG TPA: ATP-binding protein [Actinomycetota bacterium]|nr:ATP-binding protein [Actinomycetota bacterium]